MNLQGVVTKSGFELNGDIVFTENNAFAEVTNIGHFRVNYIFIPKDGKPETKVGYSSPIPDTEEFGFVFTGNEGDMVRDVVCRRVYN